MPNKLLNVATTIALGWLVSVSFAGLSFAKDRDEKKLPYPNVTDTSHATDRVADIFEGFFTAKVCTMVTKWFPSSRVIRCFTSMRA